MCVSRGHSHDGNTYQIPLMLWAVLCACSAFSPTPVLGSRGIVPLDLIMALRENTI